MTARTHDVAVAISGHKERSRAPTHKDRGERLADALVVAVAVAMALLVAALFGLAFWLGAGVGR